MKKSFLLCFVILMSYNVSCKNEDTNTADMSAEIIEGENTDTNALAEITGVTVSGNENAYTFSVTIKSPDTGCEQYANWWEVISEDGSSLLYRRILGHSHVNEQPFTRSGGSVGITKDQIVYVRAHMNTSGYGTTVFKGSVDSGFSAATLEAEFGEALETEVPQPSGCAF